MAPMSLKRSRTSKKNSTESLPNSRSINEEVNGSTRPTIDHKETVIMKRTLAFPRARTRRRNWLGGCLLGLALCPAHAHASIFKGEALDTAADVLTWVVLVVAP